MIYICTIIYKFFLRTNTKHSVDRIYFSLFIQDSLETGSIQELTSVRRFSKPLSLYVDIHMLQALTIVEFCVTGLVATVTIGKLDPLLVWVAL